jgi:DNA-binding XRE family transcriptional regulator
MATDLLSQLERFLEEKSDQETMQVAWERRFSEKMREIRVESGASVVDVAKAAGVSPSMIVQMEKGERRWRYKVAERYLRVCERAHCST